MPGNGNIMINGKNFLSFFQDNPKLIQIVQSPLVCLGLTTNFDVSVLTRGGGIAGQADAVRLGISRCLFNLVNEESKYILKAKGFLTRNSLSKERRSLLSVSIFINFFIIKNYLKYFKFSSGIIKIGLRLLKLGVYKFIVKRCYLIIKAELVL